MNRFVIAGLAAAALMAPSRAGAQAPYVCGMGTLRNVKTLIEPVATVTPEKISLRAKHKGATGLKAHTSHPAQRTRSYLVTIELDGLVYTGRSPEDAPRTFDPTRFPVNGRIPTCLDEDLLVFRPPGNETFQTTIIRTVPSGKKPANHP